MVQKIIAYQTSRGDIFETKQEADREEAIDKLAKQLCTMGGVGNEDSVTLAAFLVRHAKTVVAVLAPIADDVKAGAS